MSKFDFKNLIINNTIIIKNLFFLNVNNFVLYFAPIIVVPILIRRVGIDGYGLFVFSFAFVSYFKILVDFGFELSAPKYIVQLKQDDETNLSKIFSGLLYYKFWLILISVCLFLPIIYFSTLTNKVSLLIYCLNFITVIASFLNINAFLYSFQEIKYVTLFNSLGRLFFLFSVLFFVKDGNDLELLVLLNSLSYLLPAIGLFYFIKKKYHLRWTGYDLLFFKPILLESKNAFISGISVSLYGPTNSFLIGYFLSPALVGVFSTIEKIYNASTTLISSTSIVFYPILINKYQKSREIFKSYLNRVELFFIISSLITGIIIWLAKNLLIIFFFGENFYYANYAIWFLGTISISLIFSSFGSLYSKCFIIFGKSRYLVHFTSVGFVINLSVMFLVLYFENYILLMLPILMTQMFIAVSKKIFISRILKKAID